METLGQNRLRSLRINYRRNKIRLIILSATAIVLLTVAGVLALRIHSVKASVVAEYSHYITEAQAEREISDAQRSEARAAYDAARARNTALEAEIQALKADN